MRTLLTLVMFILLCVMYVRVRRIDAIIRQIDVMIVIPDEVEEEETPDGLPRA